MSEPIYEFIKGQGWVAGAGPVVFNEIINWDGRRYKITVLARPPREGEHGWNCWGYIDPTTNKPDYPRATRRLVSHPWYIERNEPFWGWVYRASERPDVLTHSEGYVTILQERLD